MIQCDFNKYTSKFITGIDKGKFNKQQKQVIKAFSSGELTYWNNLDSFVSREELNAIINVSDYVRENCDVFIVIGIGGSYMGSKAIMEALIPTFEKGRPEIIFL